MKGLPNWNYVNDFRAKLVIGQAKYPHFYLELRMKADFIRIWLFSLCLQFHQLHKLRWQPGSRRRYWQ